nr:hypothetical protein [Actinomadura madurae]
MGQFGGGGVQVAGELLARVVGGERPPLEAVAALVADGRPGALGGAAVGDEAQAPFGLDVVAQNEAAEDVQVVLPFGRFAPQTAADQRVDAAGPHHHYVPLVDVAVGHVQAHAGLVLLQALNAAVDPQDAVRQGGPPPLVKLGAQQPDEAAAVVANVSSEATMFLRSFPPELRSPGRVATANLVATTSRSRIPVSFMNVPSISSLRPPA